MNMQAVRRLVLAVLACFCLGWLGLPPAARADDPAAHLAPKYRDWLVEVALLIGKEERSQFMALTKDYQRDGFIYQFWEARNPLPGTTHNAFKGAWEARVEAARAAYHSLTEDRAKMLLLHGEAPEVLRTDCGMAMWPIEIWRYPGGDRQTANLAMIFYQRGGGGSYRLWHTSDGFDSLLAMDSSAVPNRDNLVAFAQWARARCVGQDDLIIAAMLDVQREDQSHQLDHVFVPPPPRDAEWLVSFRGESTDLPEGATPLPARLEVKFPGRDHGRTVVEGLLEVPVAAAKAAELEGNRAYSFLVSGEILRDSQLVESFRYRFDLPAAGLKGDTLPLVFERALREGDYTMILRVEDLQSHRGFRDERPISVPEPATLAEVATARQAPEVTAVLDAARAEVRAAAGSAAPPVPAAAAAAPAVVTPGPATTALPVAVHLIPPPGEHQTDAVRLEAKVDGEGIRKVTFYLDGKEMLSRVRPPYTVELNLGPVPVAHEVRAAAFGAAGAELGSDSLVLNAPPQRFAVRLTEPRIGRTYKGQLVARAEVQVPDGSKLDRLELMLDDHPVATLYQPPYAQVVQLPAGSGSRVVRAVAYLNDGTTAEDLAVVNSPDVVERLDVRLVELYAAVFDRGGRPVGQLAAGDFKVFDGGAPQTLLRCERVRDLPIHLLFAIDTSASMAPSLVQVQKAALGFLKRTLTAKDRAALLTFNDSPILRQAYTNDVDVLAGALSSLNAERGTALFDSVVYGLSYMKGAQHGQSALILFTDGSDHISKLSFDETLEFARRSGIAIYAIGAQVPRLALQDRAQLTKLAAETGGRSFFVDSAAELEGAYAAIEDELRSRYLLAYQPAIPGHDGEFRQVEVQVAGDGLRVKTIRGYYP
jgi:Ca-activated chloride channel family protein